MHIRIETNTAARMLLCLGISLLCAAVLVSALPTRGEEAIYDRVIRLHVLANSDTAADQTLKLQVRDAVLTELSALSAACPDADAAQELYTAYLGQLQKTAEQTVAEAGYDYACRVTLTRECYPVRTYRDAGACYTLPAGPYRSLRVMIGAAEGQNWWCVLFPPLCLSLAAEAKTPPQDAIPVAVSDGALPSGEEQLLAAGFTPYEISLISGGGSPKTTVKFRIAELLRSLIGRLRN
ncbi:MAG: stage II sporulation protein R [Clostridia bacterium]|nr:stage II sporulation protein R [Clostridia bacterium]